MRYISILCPILVTAYLVVNETVVAVVTIWYRHIYNIIIKYNPKLSIISYTGEPFLCVLSLRNNLAEREDTNLGYYIRLYLIRDSIILRSVASSSVRRSLSWKIQYLQNWIQPFLCWLGYVIKVFEIYKSNDYVHHCM